MDQKLHKFLLIVLFATLISAGSSITSTAKPGTTLTSTSSSVTSTAKPGTTTAPSTAKPGTTTAPTGTWDDLLRQLNATLVGVTNSNINGKFRIMQEIADDACTTVKLSKPVSQFQIAVYVESAVANLAENIKDNARFYLTKVLNDVVACKK